MKQGSEGRRKEGKEEGREGGSEGGREGKKEGRREGTLAAPALVVWVFLA